MYRLNFSTPKGTFITKGSMPIPSALMECLQPSSEIHLENPTTRGGRKGSGEVIYQKYLSN
eukprot:4046227-Amphidinium_carterae.1